MRNALERARLRQATRIVGSNSHNLTKADLMRIEAEDILASRVFDDDEGGVYGGARTTGRPTTSPTRTTSSSQRARSHLVDVTRT